MRHLLRIVMACLATTALAQTPTTAPTTAPMPPPDARAPLIDARALARRLAAPAPPVLIDVREAVEFAVSRLPGALRVGPLAHPEAAVARIAAHANGGDVVLYCTAAFRSRALADTIHHDLIEAGVRSVAVLGGGIIAWANAGLPLVDADGPAHLVHTYDEETARLLNDPDRGRHEPRP